MKPLDNRLVSEAGYLGGDAARIEALGGIGKQTPHALPEKYISEVPRRDLVADNATALEWLPDIVVRELAVVRFVEEEGLIQAGMKDAIQMHIEEVVKVGLVRRREQETSRLIQISRARPFRLFLDETAD
jgi:hypothetical protein